jgi:hypothetical protein
MRLPCCLSVYPHPQIGSRYSYGIRAGRLGFDSQECKIFSLLHIVQTGSEADADTVGTGGKAAWGVKLTTHHRFAVCMYVSPVLCLYFCVFHCRR